MNRRNRKRYLYIIVIVRIIMVLTLATSLFSGISHLTSGQEDRFSYFVTAFTSLLTIIITFIPSFLMHRDLLAVPTALETFFVIFTFLAQFFGEIGGFYDRFSWWDSMLHLSSGVMFAFVGYLLFCSLNRNENIRHSLNPVSVALFAFCFSLASGVIWEIFEFSGDLLLGMNMQRWKTDLSPEHWLALRNISTMSNPGLFDTMKDIIDNTIGSLCASVLVFAATMKDNHYIKSDISAEELLKEVESSIWNPRRENEN